MPERTAETLRENGFFITGDPGRLDDDGYLRIVGRGKDLIISGRCNKYPKEIELLIGDLDGVNQSAIIGAPHPDFGEGSSHLLSPKMVLIRRRRRSEKVLLQIWRSLNSQSR